MIDPRAGHGPGIGGFKIDSEVGIALQHGHPCYFVMFSPHPVPGQTIESVCAAEIAFLRKVNELHPNAAGQPFAIGNCQGGWALMMLAALAPEMSARSCWRVRRCRTGRASRARTRCATWAGCWAAAGRRRCWPIWATASSTARTWSPTSSASTRRTRYWSKLYNLYSKVDTERERFLQFERWWSGHFFMNREEIDWIVQNLFVGNKLSAGELASFDGKHRIDIRNIRSPIIVFASWGDNITPPQQALDWIPDLYRSVDDIRLNEQTIVYCLHEKAGHLGLFVSAGVARRETSELASSLDLIDTLPPGLYEAIIQDTQPEMPGRQYVEGRYLIQFVPRTIEDILALDDGRKDERAFEVSSASRASTRTLRQGRLAVREGDVERGHGLGDAVDEPGPHGAPVLLRSEPVDGMGELDGRGGARRSPAGGEGQPAARARARAAERIEQSLDQYRVLRDGLDERAFKAIYESPALALAVGAAPEAPERRGPADRTWEREELAHLKRKELEASLESGTPVDAWARLLLYVRPDGHPIDERPFNMVRRMIDELKPEDIPSLAALKAAVKRQAFVLALDPDARSPRCRSWRPTGRCCSGVSTPPEPS